MSYSRDRGYSSYVCSLLSHVGAHGTVSLCQSVKCDRRNCPNCARWNSFCDERVRCQIALSRCKRFGGVGVFIPSLGCVVASKPYSAERACRRGLTLRAPAQVFSLGELASFQNRDRSARLGCLASSSVRSSSSDIQVIDAQYSSRHETSLMASGSCMPPFASARVIAARPGACNLRFNSND